MLITLVDALLNFAQEIGYWGVVFLMAIESSLIPFPSELVVPPAAYLAAQGTLNIWLVIGASVLGSLIGALFNYFLAFYLGRPVIYRLASSKFARYLLIKPEQITRAELYFEKYDSTSTFFGRLIPVIRQLISLPAGFVRMPLYKFIFYTFLGSLLWTLVLAGLGYFFGANETLWKTYYAELTWGIIAAVVIVLGILIWKQRKKGIIK
ncbi:MAG: DedA family protein [bacterium]|nr:DedA family protein [bacterium]